ncbi:precorrin-2 dehydrogenase/sirohydrochlorin ferrochelatase family protein [Vallitalea okinawensis]|uniref:precorrin-2 dehydrogenase/sirohydrochlorin ferrochelatase family protein n=1 Tax=Vallitalea okinawensis TaxID=2078660 RepID=UPI000CFB3E26|nr:bifunctional precorrin-2 dehydrogenase/sirohydrochlorin ferrochelatase [Vallitalea okinawensis]
MHDYFPLFLKLEKMPCIVIGAGHIAYRKIRTLQKYGADVKVFTKEVKESRIREVLPSKKIIENDFKMDTLKEAYLVIAATNDEAFNKVIAEFCMKYHILVNNITSPDDCNIRFGALIEADDYQIAVSSKGRNPKEAVALRNNIKDHLG